MVGGHPENRVAPLQRLTIDYRRHYYSRPRKHSHLAHLAIAIVSELRLYSRPYRPWSTMVSFDTDPGAIGTVVRQKEPTKEEHRAFIGCYYMSSV
jgi:hypothetical protein